MTAEEFITLDGSRVVELVRPEREGSVNLSLARATVEVGRSTLWHRHRVAEEIYYVLQGEGLLEREGQRELIGVGAARLIPAGTEHRITCTSAQPLVILCACSPPYTDEDTQVTQSVAV